MFQKEEHEDIDNVLLHVVKQKDEKIKELNSVISELNVRIKNIEDNNNVIGTKSNQSIPFVDNCSSTKTPSDSPKIREQDTNIKELPESVKHMVEEGSKEFIVKGDGPCFLRTTAAHIMGDAHKGPELAR